MQMQMQQQQMQQQQQTQQQMQRNSVGGQSVTPSQRWESVSEVGSVAGSVAEARLDRIEMLLEQMAMHNLETAKADRR
jgi:hypothetical protein